MDAKVKTADRDIAKLEANFRAKVSAFMAEVGKEVFITEGFRTQERQDYLYAQGRTLPGQIVTWTKDSLHEKGKAIDIAFLGDDLFPADPKRWRRIADIALKYGIDWGQDLWGKDKPHFQCNGKPYMHPKLTSNRYIHLKGIEDLIADFELFDEYEDPSPCNAGEIKKLISIAFARYHKQTRGL